MPFRPIAPSKDVDTSSLQSLGKSMLDGLQWAYVQFNAVATSMQSTEPIKIWNTVPPKPRAGTIAYADGVNWNPGNGQGPYFYGSDNNWYPMNADGAWNVNTAWTVYTPGFSQISGSYGGAAYGRYKVMGKICFVSLQLNVSSFVSAAIPTIGLPVQAVVSSAPNAQFMLGRETAVAGFALVGQIPGSANYVEVVKYDGTAPITASGYSLSLSGSYETV